MLSETATPQPPCADASADDVLIDARDLGKVYHLYNRPQDRLKQAFLWGRKKLFRDFWALHNVSFQLRKGQMLGIIGRNGSGKSTLLQIIAGVLQPTTGTLRVNGRVAALLELGSGFNPEYTGRENVYLNGAILGLSRAEMDRRFDQIVAFADIGQFIDQPVKTYSSGMFLRLAFAVTTCVDADVLLIDEALAVGDVFFRQKCYQRLDEVRRKGTAIVLVSHSMSDIEQFCSHCLLLHHGRLLFEGDPVEAVRRYYLIEQEERAATLGLAAPSTPPDERIPQAVIQWPEPDAFIDLSDATQVSNGWARCTALAVCDRTADRDAPSNRARPHASTTSSRRCATCPSRSAASCCTTTPASPSTGRTPSSSTSIRPAPCAPDSASASVRRSPWRCTAATTRSKPALPSSPPRISIVALNSSTRIWTRASCASVTCPPSPTSRSSCAAAANPSSCSPTGWPTSPDAATCRSSDPPRPHPDFRLRRFDSTIRCIVKVGCAAGGDRSTTQTEDHPMRLACIALACLGIILIIGCVSNPAGVYALDHQNVPFEPRAGEAALNARADAPASPPLEAPEPDPSSAQLASDTTAPAVDRLMIYTAALRVVVPDIARAIESVRTTAEQLGGHLQEIDGTTITVRVPASRFQEALSACEKLGEVTQRHVRAQDITEEMRDLKIRLENAEQVRQRFVALLEQSQKMEDTLKIEVELQRVTEMIELLKGKIRYLSSQVAFSTLSVQFNSPLPQQQVVAAIPFPWVRNLGDGLLTGIAQPRPDTSMWRRKVMAIDLPAGYVRYYERDALAEAMNADNVMIKLQRHENFSGGDLAFWSKLCRKNLVENRALSVLREYDVTLEKGNKARLIVGTRQLAGQQSGYLLALAVEKNRVYAIEAWGPLTEFNRELPALERALRTLRP